MVNLLHNQMPGGKTAFVLGNGQSRLQINPSKLKPHGTIYGCNALYREFQPDFLIAVDLKMIEEIIKSGYHKSNPVWTNPKKQVTSEEGINFFNPNRGWSSGPTALWLAANHRYQEIYILGFDYEGKNGLVNNVYAGTTNYKRVNDRATYYGNWLNQTEKVIQEFSDINFFQIVDLECVVTKKLTDIHNNFQHLDYDQFKKKFNL
jgi:hypothetical protein